jgi:hypothetical protein
MSLFLPGVLLPYPRLGVRPQRGQRVLIKSADDKEPQIAALQALLARPDVDPQTRRRIDREIRGIRAGAAGERDAAYEIEFELSDSRNHMTIHDLRLEVGGRVAQIDHLVIDRLLDVWVCESKHFSEGVAVDEHAEWVAFFRHRPTGIPSPIEQNRHHVAVLTEVFKQGLVPLPTRLGITVKPKFYSLVLVSNHARITRPKGRAAAGVSGLESVIKVEQFAKTVDKTFDERGLTLVDKLVGTDKIEMLARQLVALHRPVTVDWVARFGLAPAPPDEAPQLEATPRTLVRPSCQSCGHPVSDAVVAYCGDHRDRFGGRILCMTCQKAVAPNRGPT